VRRVKFQWLDPHPRNRQLHTITRDVRARPRIGDHRTITVTQCGRICFARRKINLSTVFDGQNVGVKEVSDRIWLVSFMDYDLGFFDHEIGRLGTAENPFAAKVLPMSPE